MRSEDRKERGEGGEDGCCDSIEAGDPLDRESEFVLKIVVEKFAQRKPPSRFHIHKLHNTLISDCMHQNIISLGSAGIGLGLLLNQCT